MPKKLFKLLYYCSLNSDKILSRFIFSHLAPFRVLQVKKNRLGSFPVYQILYYETKRQLKNSKLRKSRSFLFGRHKGAFHEACREISQLYHMISIISSFQLKKLLRS